jgi:hypothetical protein
VKPTGAHKTGRHGQCGTRQAEIYRLAVAYSHIPKQDFQAILEDNIIVQLRHILLRHILTLYWKQHSDRAKSLLLEL